MAKAPVYFAHANGFPAQSYQELFDYLAPCYRLSSLPAFGHADYPVTDNWPYLVDELIASLMSQNKQPVIGIGHSMGGVLIYMAACLRPELFEQIILLDAPLFGFWRSRLLRLAKRLSLMHHLTPLERTRNRRLHFHTPEEALAYFKTKKLFQCFTCESLKHYVDSGLQPSSHGYSLRFDRAIETRIFETIPDNLSRYHLNAKIKRALIYNVHSHMVHKDLSTMRRRYHFELYPFAQGTHLFPLEYPKETAEQIMRVAGGHCAPTIITGKCAQLT